MINRSIRKTLPHCHSGPPTDPTLTGKETNTVLDGKRLATDPLTYEMFQCGFWCITLSPLHINKGNIVAS